MEKAAADGQKAVALTDHGNMFGAFKFAAAAKKNKIKEKISPIAPGQRRRRL